MTQPTPARWRKSMRSGGNGGDCVEITDHHPGIIAVRDSKDPDGPILAFTTADWKTFIADVRKDPPTRYG